MEGEMRFWSNNVICNSSMHIKLLTGKLEKESNPLLMVHFPNTKNSQEPETQSVYLMCLEGP